MMEMLRCTDSAHQNLSCGACGNPVGVQAEDYHWDFADGKLLTAYHAACKPPMPGPKGPK